VRVVALFALGQVVATPGAFQDYGPALIAELIHRHLVGDWGDLDAHDIRANNQALRTRARLLSAYETPAGRCWILTEATDDNGARGSTCVLRPQDY
jgi:hypothetical protein